MCVGTPDSPMILNVPESGTVKRNPGSKETCPHQDRMKIKKYSSCFVPGILKCQLLNRTHDKTSIAFLRQMIMLRCRKQPFGWVFVSRMIGIISFLIVVVLAKILTTFLSPDSIFLKVIEGVLFANFWLLLLIAVIMFVADIFGAFPFPLNLPSPIIRAFGTIFCIAFIISVFQWFDTTFGTRLFELFWIPSLILIPILFLIVLASGYFEIMRQLWWMPKLDDEENDQIVHQAPVANPGRQADDTLADVKSWEEIGIEFRLMLYDLMHRYRQEIKRK
jgi:hypothetical protein